MFNIYLKIRLALAALLFIAFSLSQAVAQVKIGLPTGLPNADAVLDLSNTSASNKGLLLPFVALQATNSHLPLVAMVAGMEVYNTATAGSGSTAVVPGIYFNDGISWILLVGALNKAATFTANSLSCAGAKTGGYHSSVMTIDNTQGIFVNVSTPGSYSASTNKQNGIIFSATGTLSNIGTNNITLTANGTPAGFGTFLYTISLGGLTNTFTIAFYDSLQSSLSTSLSAYQNAPVNTWVSITANEYANISNNVSSMAKYYSTDAELGARIPYTSSNYTYSADGSQTQIPAYNYPVALAVVSGYDTPASMAGLQLKLSTTSLSNGYVDFPASGTTTSNSTSVMAQYTIYYWVIKSPTIITSALTFAAMYAPYGIGMVTSSQPGFLTGGNSNTLTSSGGSTVIQFLATPIKSW